MESKSKESTARTAGALTHPNPGEWMEFLYEETEPTRRTELLAHLGECALCAAQVDQWRERMQAPDKFELPPPARKKIDWVPVLRLPAAAAIVISPGLWVTLGRRSS